MLNFIHKQSGKAAIAVLLVGTTLLGSFVPVSAKPVRRQANTSYNLLRSPSSTYNRSQSVPTFNRNQSQIFSNPNQGSIPVGTTIPMTFNGSETIQISPNESRAITLNTASNVRQANGNILIPAGSEVLGELRPSRNGVQFFAQQITLKNGQRLNFNATSRELVGFQTVNEGASTADIVTGTLAGAGAATLIAGVTGDRHINALEVLGGAAFGALAGWGLPQAGIIGGGTKEVMTIDPSQDLTLTVQAPLYLNNTSSPSQSPSQSQGGRDRYSAW
jgi:hypothetical protein